MHQNLKGPEPSALRPGTQKLISIMLIAETRDLVRVQTERFLAIQKSLRGRGTKFIINKNDVRQSPTTVSLKSILSKAVKETKSIGSSTIAIT